MGQLAEGYLYYRFRLTSCFLFHRGRATRRSAPACSRSLPDSCCVTHRAGVQIVEGLPRSRQDRGPDAGATHPFGRNILSSTERVRADRSLYLPFPFFAHSCHVLRQFI